MAEPDLLAFWVLVAIQVDAPMLVGVTTPEELTVPFVAVQVTPAPKLPIPCYCCGAGCCLVEVYRWWRRDNRNRSDGDRYSDNDCCGAEFGRIRS